MTKSDLEERIASRRTFTKHDQEAELWIFEAQIFDAVGGDRVFPWRSPSIHWISHPFLLLSTLGGESRGLDRGRQFWRAANYGGQTIVEQPIVEQPIMEGSQFYFRSNKPS